jgi:hypothetical protein
MTAIPDHILISVKASKGAFVDRSRKSAFAVWRERIINKLEFFGIEVTEDAINAEMQRTANGADLIVVFGVVYPSINAAAKANGVNHASVHNRVRRGDTVEAAIVFLKTEGAPPKTRRSVTFLGKPYLSTRAACIAHGVRDTAVQQRIKRRGETVEQAITHLLQNR